MTQQNIEFKAIPGQFNIDEAQGIVECFVAGIGNKDSVGDVLVSGAFSKSLQRRKPRVVWGHNWNDPIGKVLEIYEVAPGDRRLPSKMLNAGIGGLYAKVQFNLNSEKGREAFANVAFFGQEQEWSIGYKTLDSIFDPNLQANILKEVELYEVSPVLHGANQLTGTISVKSDESTMVDDSKGGVMMFGSNRGPFVGRPTGMMPHRQGRPTPNILEANKPGIGDERKNQLEIELAVRAGAPVKVRLAEENTVIFDRMTPDGAPTTYRVAYHFTGKEFMFGKPEKVSVQTVYVPSSEESGSRVVIPSQMPSMPMQVKPQGNAYMGDDREETGVIMPKSYDGEEKWSFDEDFADLANIISDSLDVKVGRALSARNMSKLKAILENLQEVIASAEKDVQEKSDYIIPVPIENAFETKQLLDPIFDYHRVESHVTEDGIVVTSGVTNEFIEAIGVAEKALGRTLSGGLGKLGRAARGAARFDPNAWDGDGDGLVQEGTPFQRPAIPGVNDRATGGRVNARAATRAFEQQGGLASAGKRPQPADWQIPATEKNDKNISVIDSEILAERMSGLSLEDAAEKFGISEAAVRQRELREMRRLREFVENPNEEILAYRMMGLSADDTASLFGKSREEIRKIEMAQLKKLREEKDDDFILALRERGVSLGQIAKATGLKDTEVRKREQMAINSRPEIPLPDKPGAPADGGRAEEEDFRRRRGLASSSGGDSDFDEDARAWAEDTSSQLARDEERIARDEDARAWSEDVSSQLARDEARGLASTSVQRRGDALRGEVIGSSNEINSLVDMGFIKNTHGELLNDILKDITPENIDSEDAGSFLSNVKRRLVRAIADGKFNDYRDVRQKEDTLKDYINEQILRGVLNSISETMDNAPSMRKTGGKRRSNAEELKNELIDTWGDSLIRDANIARRNQPPSKEDISRAKKKAREQFSELLDDIENGTVDREPEEFLGMLDDIARLDPAMDSEEIVKELREAVQIGIKENSSNSSLRSIAEQLGTDQGRLDDLVEGIEEAKLDSDFLPERMKMRQNLSRGLASSSYGPPQGWYEPDDDSPGYMKWESMDPYDVMDEALGNDMVGWATINSGNLDDDSINELIDNLDLISDVLEKEWGGDGYQKYLQAFEEISSQDRGDAVSQIKNVLRQRKPVDGKAEETLDAIDTAITFYAIGVHEEKNGFEDADKSKLWDVIKEATDAYTIQKFDDDYNNPEPPDWWLEERGLASRSVADGPFKYDSFLRRTGRAADGQNGVLDSEILKDFISGMSAAEISEKRGLGGARFAQSAANRERSRLRQNANSEADSNMDILMYRASGLSVGDTAKLFGISPLQVRMRERKLKSSLKKKIDDEDLLYLRSSLSLEETSDILGIEPRRIRQMEQAALRRREAARGGRRARGLASRSWGDGDDSLYDEAVGPNPPRRSRGMQSDEIGDAVADAVDRDREIEGRTGIPRRGGLASQSREMDMTLEEYAKLNEVLEKYLDESQVDGIGSDEDMKNLQEIIEKLDDSRVANDSVPLTDAEIDDYIDTLSRMNEFGPVEEGADKNQIQGLIDSLRKTKESTDGTYESDALQQAGTRLSVRGGESRTGKRTRPFRTVSGTINPHKKLEIELNEDEIGLLRDEVSQLVRSSENPNILRAVGEKLEKSKNGKFTIDDKEYEDVIKAIEQSKSRSGMITSDLLGVIEQAAETNDGKYSSVNMRNGGLASANGGRRPNNGAPPDITEGMQKEYIFWAKSANARNLRLVQEALDEYNKNDGQLPPSMWRRLRTMYENLSPGSARGGRRGMVGRGDGSGRRARTGLASASEGGYEGRSSRPGIPGAMRPADFEVRGEGEVGKGGAMGSGMKDKKFTGLSLDEAKPDNWDELSSEEKFDWLMYEGNPSKVSDPNQRMSEAAHEGAIKQVLRDIEREERRSMTPEERRAERAQVRERNRAEISEEEATRRAEETKKRAEEAQKTPKTYKPKENAKEARDERMDILQSYQDKIEETKRKLGELDYEGDFNPSAEDIWETVYALLGDNDMTKKSINDAFEALDEYIEINSPGENAYEKLSIKQAKALLNQLGKTRDKYSNDPWIVDDLPTVAGLASRGGGSNRPGPNNREMPQSNAKRENEMKRVIDLAQQVVEDLRKRQEEAGGGGRRARTGLASTSRPKAMITDEATFFKDIEGSLQKEIRNAQKANNQNAVNGLSKLQEVIRKNEASKTGSRRTNVGSIYLTDDEADMVMDGLMFALDNQIEQGGEKRIEWYTKLLEKIAQEAMSTFIDKKF